MTRALVLVTLLAGFVTAPTGWRQDVEQANALAAKANAMSQFGGARAVATARVFVPDAGPGALYVTMIAAKVKDHRDAAARVAVDGFLGAPKRAQLSSVRVSVARSESRIDVEAKQIEALLQWKDDQIMTHARLVIAGDDENLIAVTGECIVTPDTNAVVRDACLKALASLDPGIAADKRVVLELAPEGSEPPAPAPTAGSAGSGARAPTMSDGPRTPMPPMHMPPAPARAVDRRPVYVGAGIVVLAGLFWWNRRRREQLEAKAEKRDTDE